MNESLMKYMAEHQSIASFFEKAPVKELSQVELRSYEKGEYIIREGVPFQHIFVVLSGIADAMPDLHNGSRQVCYRLSRGDVTGLYGLSDDSSCSPMSVSAHSQVVCALIPFQTMLGWRVDFPGVLLEAYRRQMDSLYQSGRLLMECGASSPYYATIAYLIFDYHLFLRVYEENYRGSVRIDESRQNIADFLGKDVRSVNRAIERLKTQEMVTVLRGKIHISPRQLELLQQEQAGKILRR